MKRTNLFAMYMPSGLPRQFYRISYLLQFLQITYYLDVCTSMISPNSCEILEKHGYLLRFQGSGPRGKYIHVSFFECRFRIDSIVCGEITN